MGCRTQQCIVDNVGNRGAVTLVTGPEWFAMRRGQRVEQVYYRDLSVGERSLVRGLRHCGHIRYPIERFSCGEHGENRFLYIAFQDFFLDEADKPRKKKKLPKSLEVADPVAEVMGDHRVF